MVGLSEKLSIMFDMKSLMAFTVVLFFAGCLSQSRELESDVSNQEVLTATNPPYAVLTEAPTAVLDEWAEKYFVNERQWYDEWEQHHSTNPIDGQGIVHLLEIACYADVTCHKIEYPARKATHDFIRKHLEAPEVLKALNWIRTSYESGLPLDEPGDETGQLKGMLVEAMRIRMKNYAKQLLPTDGTKSSAMESGQAPQTNKRAMVNQKNKVRLLQEVSRSLQFSNKAIEGKAASRK